MDSDRLALSFGSAAARYEQFRPSYPAAAIDAVLTGLDRPQAILDLGAGTGKLTRSLIGLADEIIAIEPDEQMRAQLQAQLPTVTVRAGSAEDTGLADNSVDAVFVGQAFHWFARPAADVGLGRILRPGGVVGLIWNLPDFSTLWGGRVVPRPRGHRPHLGRVHRPTVGRAVVHRRRAEPVRVGA